MAAQKQKQINKPKQFCEKLKHFYFSSIAIVTTAEINQLCKFFLYFSFILVLLQL